MTIPATTDYFLVQNIFQLGSGLPEDVVVNNFIFRNQNNAGPLQTIPAQTRAAEAVRDFYVGTAPAIVGQDTTTQTIMAALSNAITDWTQKVYDLGLPPGGRVPTVFDRTEEMVARSGGTPIPNECAVVLTLQTAIIGRRGKGRVYLGPWGSSGVLNASPAGPTVAANLRNRIVAQAAKLALGNEKDVEWAVWSTTRSAMERVRGGWCDDAFDTQRRRGVDATTRSQFGQVTPTTAP